MHMEERASAADEPSSSQPTKKRRKSGASQRTSTGSAGTSAATATSLDGRARKLTAAQRALQEAAEAEEQPATPPGADGPSATLIVRSLRTATNCSSAIMRTHRGRGMHFNSQSHTLGPRACARDLRCIISSTA